VLGGIRGVFFANLGGGYFDGQPAAPPRNSGGGFKWWTSSNELYTPINGYIFTGITQTPIYGTPVPIDGFRLVDSRASYGVGLETFALGFPIHFDWAWKTLFNRDWEDALFRPFGGSDEFRKVKFSVWIGYDF
jgi:hypothetical protein